MNEPIQIKHLQLKVMVNDMFSYLENFKIRVSKYLVGDKILTVNTKIILYDRKENALFISIIFNENNVTQRPNAVEMFFTNEFGKAEVLKSNKTDMFNFVINKLSESEVSFVESPKSDLISKD